MSTILLLEDSDILRGQWKRALMKEGFHVVEALTGNQMFDILLNEEVDLIVLDLFLGSEHGYHVIKRIKQDPNYRKIPIIVASPERRRESIQEVINEGIVDYLIKPLEVDFFVRRIKRIFTRVLTA